MDSAIDFYEQLNNEIANKEREEGRIKPKRIKSNNKIRVY